LRRAAAAAYNRRCRFGVSFTRLEKLPVNVVNPLPSGLDVRLRGLERRIRLARGVRRLALAALAGAGGMLAVWAWDALFAMPVRGLRLANLALAGAVVAGLAGVIHSLWAPIARSRLAALVETRFAALGERLASVVELHAAGAADSELLQGLDEETQALAASLDFRRAYALAGTRRTALLAGGALLLALAPACFSSDYARLQRRLLFAWSPAVYGYDLVVTPADRFVGRGRAATVSVQLVPREPEAGLPESCILVVHEDGPEARSKPRTIRLERDAAGSFGYTWPALTANLRYRAATRDLSSAEFAIDVVEPVNLTAGAPDIEVMPPGYVNPQTLPAAAHAGMTPFTALQYSSVRFRFAFDRPAQKAAVRWHSPAGARTVDLALTAGGQQAEWQLLASDPGAHLAELIVAAEHDVAWTHPLPGWSVWSDAPPRLTEAPALDLPSAQTGPRGVASDDVLPIKAVIEDEVGVGAVTWEYRVNDGPVERLALAEGRGLGRVAVDAAFALAGKAKEGDVVKCRLRVEDNRRLAAESLVGFEGRRLPQRALAPHTIYFPAEESGAPRWWTFRIDKANELLARQRRDVKELARLAAKEAELAKQAAALADDPQATPEQLEQLRGEQAKVATMFDELLADNPRLQPVLEAERQARARQLARHAQELAMQQRAVAQAAEKARSAAAGKHFAALAARQEELAQRVAALGKDLASRPGASGLAAPSEPAGDAAERLRDGHIDQALARQRQTHDELKRLADTLAEARALEGDPRADVQRFAKAQADLRRRLEQLGEDFPRLSQEEARARLAAIAQGEQGLHDALVKLPVPKAWSALQQAAALALKQAAELLERKDALAAYEQMEEAQGTLQRLGAVLPETPPNRPPSAQLPFKKQSEEARRLAREQQALEDAVRQQLAAMPKQALPEQALTEPPQEQKLRQALADFAKEVQEFARRPGQADKGAAGDAARAAAQAQRDYERSAAEKARGMPLQAQSSEASAARQLDMAGQKLEDAARARAASPGDEEMIKKDAELRQAAAEARMQLGKAQQQLRAAPRNAAPAMQQAAKALEGAARQAQKSMARAMAGAGAPGPAAPPAANGSDAQPSAAPITESDLKALAGKSWGELPGELRTRIVQDMRARYGDDYGRIIQRYFQQIADTQPRLPE
jgi:hypothetical protein